MDGGEARALTSLKQGVGWGPVWSPDGKQVAFTAGPADPPKLDKPYRVTRPFYRFDGMGCLDGAVQDVYVISVAGSEPRRLTHDGWHNTAPHWSPDGQEILYTASMNPNSHDFRCRLRAVTLGGEVREISGNWGAAAYAAWTPDGTRVVFVGQPDGRHPAAKSDLWVVGREGGEPECRTAGLPIGVAGQLQQDMPAFWGTLRSRCPKMAKRPICRFRRVGTCRSSASPWRAPSSWAPVVAGVRASFVLDLDGEHLLFAVSTPSNPTALFIADLAGEGERQLTHLNADLLAELALPTVEHLLFLGSDGVQVEGWLHKPPSGEAPYPTILYIHGGPHAGFGNVFSFDFQMLCGAGYAVLAINHRGSTGYGDEFSTRIIGDWGNQDFQDLMAGVDYAIERGLADPQRLGCCGLSGGGNLSCWIVGQTARFKAAVPENPVTNFVSMYGVSDISAWVAEELGGKPHEVPEVYRRCSPITYAHRCTTPTLLIQGELDLRCPAEQSEQFYTVLKASGCVVEMLRLPGSPHGGSLYGEPIIRRAQNEALLEWMNRYVLGAGGKQIATAA